MITILLVFLVIGLAWLPLAAMMYRNNLVFTVRNEMIYEDKVAYDNGPSYDTMFCSLRFIRYWTATSLRKAAYMYRK